MLINNNGKYGYKYLLLLVVIYMVTFPLVGLGLHKPVEIASLHIQASSLIYPITFFVADIITEVYGYQVIRQLIWCQIPGTIYYQSVLFIILYGVPTPTDWQHQSAYEFVFSGMGIIGYFGDFALIIAFFVNSYLISKWKILLLGKFFWLRSIGSGLIGEFIQLSIGLLGTVAAHVWSPEEALTLFYNVLLYRAALTFILAPIGNFITSSLKKAEQIDIFDRNTNFNPFRFTIRT